MTIEELMQDYIPVIIAGKEIFGYKPRTTEEYIRNGRFPLPTVKVGRARYVSINEIQRYLAKKEKESKK